MPVCHISRLPILFFRYAVPPLRQGTLKRTVISKFYNVLSIYSLYGHAARQVCARSYKRPVTGGLSAGKSTDLPMEGPCPGMRGPPIYRSLRTAMPLAATGCTQTGLTDQPLTPPAAIPSIKESCAKKNTISDGMMEIRDMARIRFHWKPVSPSMDIRR